MNSSVDRLLIGRKICLISSVNLSTNPRIVKEADALTEAGAEITVVSARYTARYCDFDSALVSTRKWRHIPVEARREEAPFAVGWRALLKATLAAMPAFLWRIPWVAEGAFSRVTGQLRDAAAKYAPNADFYLAHTLAALPAAAAASARTGARLGFDLEDCHWGEFPDGDESKLRALVRLIEDRYLPKCDHLTAASPLIADHYAERFGRQVISVLNAFPLAERTLAVAAHERPLASLPTLYWLSQTVGEGRGLEWVVAALGHIPRPHRLILRGNPVPGYPERLKTLLRGVSDKAGCQHQLELQPLSSPERLVATCAVADVGLSVEDGRSLNRRLCLTNKIFYYLLAGVPVIMSDTLAQKILARELREAALVVPYGDSRGLAEAVRSWTDHPNLLAQAGQRAWELGTHTFNWGEQAKILMRLVAEGTKRCA